MTDLLKRCVEAANHVPEKSFDGGVYQTDVFSIIRAVIATIGAELTDEHIAALRKVARLNNIYLDAGVTVGLPKALGEILAVTEAIVETNRHD